MSAPRLLYIDDEKDLLELAASFFEDENFDVTTCSDFRRALELVKSGHFDVIITDEKMPSGSGIEFIKMIKEEKVYTGRVILVTGNLRELTGDEEELIQDVMFKPICFQTLIEKVRGAISSTPVQSDSDQSP